MTEDFTLTNRGSHLFSRMPRDDREWIEFIDELFKGFDGRARIVLSDIRSLPNSITRNRGSVQNIAPITASDAGSDVTISVAAHTVTDDVGTVSYSAGSITGLSYSTRYFVYCVDTGLDGGAVTYLASTSPTDLFADKDTYYVGAVTTPAAGAADVTGSAGAGAGTTTDPEPDYSSPGEIWP